MSSNDSSSTQISLSKVFWTLLVLTFLWIAFDFITTEQQVPETPTEALDSVPVIIAGDSTLYLSPEGARLEGIKFPESDAAPKPKLKPSPEEFGTGRHIKAFTYFRAGAPTYVPQVTCVSCLLIWVDTLKGDFYELHVGNTSPIQQPDWLFPAGRDYFLNKNPATKRLWEEEQRRRIEVISERTLEDFDDSKIEEWYESRRD